jgi:hypothetical protein
MGKACFPRESVDFACESAIELMMAFIKTFGLITIFMFLFISIYFGKSCFKQACTLLTMS